MAEVPLDHLLARAKNLVKDRKPNPAIIAQLTGGKERGRKPRHPDSEKTGVGSEHGFHLVLDVSVNNINGAGVGIGILQHAESTVSHSATPTVPCPLQPSTFQRGCHGGYPSQARVESPEGAQIYALSRAVLLARDTVRDQWPRDAVLRAVRFRIGLTYEKPDDKKHVVATLLDGQLKRWNGRDFGRTAARKKKRVPHETYMIAKRVDQLQREMLKVGSSNPLVRFEDQTKMPLAHKAAKQKLRAMKTSPRWKWRRQYMDRAMG